MKQKGARSERAKARFDLNRKRGRLSLLSSRFYHRNKNDELHRHHGGGSHLDGSTRGLGLSSSCHPSRQYYRLRAKHSSRAYDTGENGDILPSAPPMEVLDRVTGYENLSFESVIIPPPPHYKSQHHQNGNLLINEFDIDPALGTWVPSSLRTSIPQMTESGARTALQSHVKHHCCWGVGPARQMTVSSINQIFAYHYILQTFTERREAFWTWAPHVGGDIDGPEEGTAPSPWEIQVAPPKLFQNEVTTYEVPHTASVKPCHRCRGTGTLSCAHCHGKGWTRCLSCHGDGLGHYGGSESRERCMVCAASAHGHGRQDCRRCEAKGKISCSVCDTYGQLKCFIQLTISWKVSVGEHVTGGEELSPDLIRQVEGEVGLEESGLRLNPLSPDIAPDDTLSVASAQLIHDHLQNSNESLLLAQRHRVRLVPVSVVDYQWKRYQGKFYVYGLDKRVSAPDYPQTCCCGCNIV